MALSGLGIAHARLGNNDLARGYAREALEVTPDTGWPDILGVRTRLDRLGLP